MPNKILLFDNEAREALLRGAEKLAKAVTSTLGPSGNNVALDRNWGAPAVVHDGVSVAKDIDLDDNFENMGAKLIKQAATQTGDNVGDGTTTAILLAFEMLKAGIQKVKDGGNAMGIRKGMELAALDILSKIDTYSQPVRDKQDLIRISTISAGDEVIGLKIAEALEKVGPNGLVTVEQGQSINIEVDYKEGMELNQGYTSLAFVNRGEYLDTYLEDVDILLIAQKISAVADIAGLDAYLKTGRKLLIVVSEIDGEAFETLVMTRISKGIPICVVRAPGFGDNQKQMLEDVAVATGGVVFSVESGRTLKTLSPEFSEFGHAEKIHVTRDNCQIIGGKGTKADVKKRIDELKAQIKNTTSDYDKNKLTERLAKITGGVAVIKVGAPSESEMIEKTERAKDAVEATRAAVAEGIVPGGGITLYNIFSEIVTPKNLNADQTSGYNLVVNTLLSPLKKLLTNAGENADDKIAELIQYDKGNGYDINTGKINNMLAVGIIDPTKVTKTAFRNAVSVAASMLTTCALVTDVRTKNQDDS